MSRMFPRRRRGRDAGPAGSPRPETEVTAGSAGRTTGDVTGPAETAARAESRPEAAPPPAAGASRAERRPRDDARVVSHPVRAASEWAWRFLVIVAAAAVLAYVVVRFRLVVFPVVIALLLAALLQPTVARLLRWGVPRLLAAAIVFVSGIVVVTGTLTGVGTLLATGIQDISTSVLKGINQIRNWLTGPLGLSEDQLNTFINSAWQTIQQNTNRIASGALATAGTAAQILAGIALTLFVTFFFLYDGARIWRWCVRLFPGTARPHVSEAGQRAWRTLVSYVRGTVIVAAVDAVFIGIILVVLGVPLAVPLAILVFLGAFVPLVGAFVTGAIAVLVALVTNGFVTALIVLGGIILVQQIEGNVLQPLLLGRMVKVHALAVVLVVTAGGLIGGIAGAVIAVPFAAVVNTVLRYFAGNEDTGSTGESGELADGKPARSP